MASRDRVSITKKSAGTARKFGLPQIMSDCLDDLDFKITSRTSLTDPVPEKWQT